MSEEKAKPVRAAKEKEPEIVMDSEAFSVARDKDGRYYLVTLKFDLESGKAVIEEKLQQDNRSEAFQRFKIRVAQSPIMGS